MLLTRSSRPECNVVNEGNKNAISQQCIYTYQYTIEVYW
nr:MAG TPA: hypothetical protein [Caudoviricetes sp.]